MGKADDDLRDRVAWHVFTAGFEATRLAADYRAAVNALANRSYLAADAMLAARAKDPTP